jgi:phage terminase small subunit
MCVSAPAEAIEVIPGNTRGWPRTKLQLDFALNVVQEAMNPHAAMIAAGYAKNSSKVRSHELAANLRPFMAFLQEKKNEVAAIHYDATTTRILHEMSAIGLQNIKDYIRVVKVDKVLHLIGRPVNELTDSQALAVASWESHLIQTDDGPDFDFKYVLHDKASALVNLGRHLGMFSEKLMLDLNMRQSQARSLDFSALPQDELELVIKTLEGIQQKASKARAIEGESHRVD